MSKPLLRVRGLSAGYDKEPVIRDISFDVYESEICVIMGPNGAGKSTLLRSIIGLARVYSGEIEVCGYRIPHDIKNIRRIIGYVPQREYVSQNIPVTTKDVVLSGITLRKGPLYIPTRKDMYTVRRVLERVGIGRELWFKKFNELSGGQQQKVLLARALVFHPRILLLDEPFSGIDIKSLREIIDFLVEIKKSEKLGIVIVLHEISEILAHVDRIMLLNKRMVACGDVLSVLTPENLKQTYGVDVDVIPYGDKCLPIIGDRHA